jgi:predicted DNA-binding protein (MmcQ/YjbR family)
MTGRSVVSWCLSRPGVTDGYPFGPDTRVFKVGGKMFAACPRGTSPNRINLKSEPATALRLRREYAGITPGYHMNKAHWNTVQLDGRVPREVLKQMLEASYRLVVDSLPAAQRSALIGAGFRR